MHLESDANKLADPCPAFVADFELSRMELHDNASPAEIRDFDERRAELAEIVATSRQTVVIPEKGKHDPDEMESDRAFWGSEIALAIRAAIADLTGNTEETALSDALCYLMYSEDLASELRDAAIHFHAETRLPIGFDK